MSGEVLDLLVVGAGPTGIALGAEAKRAGFSTLLVDRGPLVASLVDYPNDMLFFTTRERLEIAGVPFSLPEDKPNRRQAIAYYQGVASAFELPISLREEITAIEPLRAGGFRILGRSERGETERRASAVAVATGYFSNPLRLGVPGEDLPWVQSRYREPWSHFGENVTIIGAGNSGAEAALDLLRHGARVTLVHRGESPKATVKYWVRPDLENRLAEGSIRGIFSARVIGFEPGVVLVEHGGATERVESHAAYVLIGYEPDMRLLTTAGVRHDRETLEPEFDPVSCESNISGLYIAGTIQAGRETHRIFIENSRDHCVRIVADLVEKRRSAGVGAAGGPLR